jgi:hypothetical protein
LHKNGCTGELQGCIFVLAADVQHRILLAENSMYKQTIALKKKLYKQDLVQVIYRAYYLIILLVTDATTAATAMLVAMLNASCL